MIYLDHNSSYPSSLEHLEEVLHILSSSNGNPSSTHSLGRKAKSRLEVARAQIARLLAADPGQVFFNSGATEGNNTVLNNLVCRVKSANSIIAMTGAEHPSIIGVGKNLEKNNFCKVKLISLDSSGTIDLESLQKLLSEYEVLGLALNFVNNETGAINPIQKIVDIVKSVSPKTHIHCDMVQALGKMDLKWVAGSFVDSVSLSAHKIGGFKGVGALYYKNPSDLTVSLLYGGSQECGVRAGTENLSGIISFGLKAQELLEQNSWASVWSLKDYFLEKTKNLKKLSLNIDPQKTVCNTINFHIDGVEASEILLKAEDSNIQISSKSACASGLAKPSETLKAMGFHDHIALNSIRVSFGPESTKEDIDSLVKVLSYFK